MAEEMTRGEKTTGAINSRMYLAVVVEDAESGFHRETLWYGSEAENLASMIIDVIKDWYEPNKERLSQSVLDYHAMLEDSSNITFEKLEGEGVASDGMRVAVELTNDLRNMFGFVLNEICDIFGKEGEAPDEFESLDEFRAHFADKYEVDEDLLKLFDGINEMTLSRALYLIDMKYGYTGRHFRSGKGE